MRQMEVVLVRHGQTEWSRDLRHTGRTDVPLTDEGRAQAERLRDPLRDWTFNRVLASPLSRALDTCRLAGFGDSAELSDALLEWDYGDYEGETTAQISALRPGWNLWRDGCPGGEAAADLGARVDPLISELKASDGDVLVFAHGHLLRVLAARWVELPPEAGAKLWLATATISVLGFERETPAFRRWNAPVR
ncbi:MAG TPA: histidine phosphatase family protein [Thermoleophilaceae bacterium]